MLFLGAWVSNLYLVWYQVMGILFLTLLMDFLMHKLKSTTHFYPFSSLSTAIGVMLMMATPYLWIYGVVIGLALLQKQYLKVDGAHFFNPSNFALIMGLLLFYDDAHIILGQLGDERWLRILLTVMAVAILVRVNRWLISVAFILFYLLFQYALIVSSDPLLIMEEIYYRFYSVSFILFILFMLTDPRTTPRRGYQQTVFAFLIAFFTAIFDRLYGFRLQHLFLALFLFSLFVPLVETWRERSKAMVGVTLLLLLLATVVIITIEIQPPFYFTMDD